MDFIKSLSLLGITFLFSHCGNTPQIIYEEEYIYNEEGQLTAILVKETDKDTSWTKDSFIYDSLKRKIAMERTSSRFKSTETTTYQYDSDGDTIAVKTTGGNDSFDKLFLYTYANKAGHKVIIETEQYHINDTKDTTVCQIVNVAGRTAYSVSDIFGSNFQYIIVSVNGDMITFMCETKKIDKTK